MYSESCLNALTGKPPPPLTPEHTPGFALSVKAGHAEKAGIPFTRDSFRHLFPGDRFPHAQTGGFPVACARALVSCLVDSENEMRFDGPVSALDQKCKLEGLLRESTRMGERPDANVCGAIGGLAAGRREMLSSR